MKEFSNQSKENFLLSLLQKVLQEYKSLWNFTRRARPYKIVDILSLSSIPGETEFKIQVTNKSCAFAINAADLIQSEYHLDNFSDFHAEMIRHAAKGTLLDFLKFSASEPRYKIVSKRFDREEQKYLFTLQGNTSELLIRTAPEIAGNKNLLNNLSIEDVYSVGYTQGSETCLGDEAALRVAKQILKK